jgi:hypothetical protein
VDGTECWNETLRPLASGSELFLAIMDDYDFTENDHVDDDDEFGDRRMLDAKHEATLLHQVAEAQKYLSGTQKSKFEKDLAK